MKINVGSYSLGMPRIGVVLSSGSARGWAHVGVLQALDQAHIPIHVIAGASAGAVIGSFYAAGAMSRILYYADKHKSKKNTYSYIDFSLRGGILKGEKFLRFLYEYIPARRFDQLNIPMGIVASDLASMKEVHFTSGLLIPAVRASTAVPTAFAPVELDNHQLVDGGLLNPIPVHLARKLGADMVIAVDLDNTEPYVRVKSPIDAFYRSMWTMTTRITQENLDSDPPDILIKPDLNHFGYTDYHRAKEAFEIGYESAREKVPSIQKLINKKIYKNYKYHLKKRRKNIHPVLLSFSEEMEPRQKRTGMNSKTWWQDMQKLPPQLLHVFFDLSLLKYSKVIAKTSRDKIISTYQELKKGFSR